MLLAAGLLLPGLGRDETRSPADATAWPWSAVVLVQVASVSSVSRCTGFLIEARRVLTAAHCLSLPRVRHLARPESVHVLSGYRSGRFAAHVVAERLRVVEGWDSTSPGADAAVVTLAAPIGGPALPLTSALPGQPAMLGGYEQDRRQVLLADTACRIVGTIADRHGRVLRRHDCAATSGSSGAPLLVRNAAGEWAAAGLQTLAVRDGKGGLAVDSETLTALIASK